MGINASIYYDVKDLKIYIQLLCSSRAITQKELAEKMGISRPYFSAVINLKKPFLKKYYDKICDILQLTSIEQEMLGKYVEGNDETKSSIRKKLKVHKNAIDKIKHEISMDEYFLYTCGWEENASPENIKSLYKSLRENIDKILKNFDNEIKKIEGK